MKFLFIIWTFTILALGVKCDLLDDHDHHHDHDDDHDDHHDDLHDHIEDQLEDHFDRDSDELPHNSLFVNQLSGFLPSDQISHAPQQQQHQPQRRKKIDFPDFSPPEDETFDVSHFNFNEPEPVVVRNGPIEFPDFSPPAHSSILTDDSGLRHEEVPHNNFVFDVKEDIPEIQVIDHFEEPLIGKGLEFLDDSAELPFHPEEPSDPALHPIEPNPQPIQEVEHNFIGGQGRQLGVLDFDDGSSEEYEYPHYAFVPQTSFSCADQAYGGYFADIETDCQVFHICLNGGLMGSFLCPNQTVFNQHLFVCDWWFNVDCSTSSIGYDLNTRIGTDEHFLL